MYAVPLAPVIWVDGAAALALVVAEEPAPAEVVTDDVAEEPVVSLDLFAWPHPAPISANPTIAAENAAARVVIARISFPLEFG
ncbi:hypothetical protein MHEI_29290 [Mycobacterium heidelbergense]|nr:hypothetical protein MHEI_29290 [Mycobacterium heidelbergense]